MRSTRYFYVVYCADPAQQFCLDVIRFLADPAAKGFAHITVRGPYLSQPSMKLPLLATEGEEVQVTGLGDFFSTGQNTVYLKCTSPALLQRWYKPDYGYQPHITLYDGSDLLFAQQLRDVLKWTRDNLSIKTTSLARLISQSDSIAASLRQAIDSVGLSSVIGRCLTSEEAATLPRQSRLQLIEQVWRYFLSLDRHRLSGKDLFGQIPSSDTRLGPEDHGYRDLSDLVVAAYLRVYGGASIDRTLAEPEANVRFLRECWRLGAQASQYDLNRALLNARKTGKVGPVPNVAKVAFDPDLIEQYLFATEVSLRVVQDEEWFSRQRYVSLDHILCDPSLSYRFDTLTRLCAPGFSPGQYRWAAISIRKSQRPRRSVSDTTSLDFQEVGKLGLLRPAALANEPGIYWLRYNHTSLYIGHSERVRDAVENILALRLREIPLIHRSVSFRLKNIDVYTASVASSSRSSREYIKAKLVDDHHPRMNVLRRRGVGA
jgi:hypothetical protein